MIERNGNQLADEISKSQGNNPITNTDSVVKSEQSTQKDSFKDQIEEKNNLKKTTFSLNEIALYRREFKNLNQYDKFYILTTEDYYLNSVFINGTIFIQLYTKKKNLIKSEINKIMENIYKASKSLIAKELYQIPYLKMCIQLNGNKAFLRFFKIECDACSLTCRILKNHLITKDAKLIEKKENAINRGHFYKQIKRGYLIKKIRKRIVKKEKAKILYINDNYPLFDEYELNIINKYYNSTDNL